MRIGGLGLGGLTLPALRQAQSALPTSVAPTAKRVILLGLTGGAPQHETWDPKPEAPNGIRGDFGTIASATPGLNVGELMPLTAKWTNRVAVLRAVVTGDSSHSSSGYQMLTGIPHQPRNRESALPKPPNNWPCVGAMVRALKDDTGQIPSAITVPEHIWNDGNFPWPGQDAGFLGRPFDPWLINCQPQDNTFNVPGLTLGKDVAALRLQRRRRLLDQIDDAHSHLDSAPSVGTYQAHARQALELLTRGKAGAAFDLSRESDKTRDRYGRSRYAQSVLLARRLIEADVSLVQINWTRIKGKPNQGGWDTHANNFEGHREQAGILDPALFALITDLKQHDLLDSTIVLVLGEFGRTPTVNPLDGRDHWPHGFSCLVGGGGLATGRVLGATDPTGRNRKPTRPIEIADLFATILSRMGVKHDKEMITPIGRPMAYCEGTPIPGLL